MAETLEMCLWKATASACGDEPEVGIGLRASSQEEEAGTETREWAHAGSWGRKQDLSAFVICGISYV